MWVYVPILISCVYVSLDLICRLGSLWVLSVVYIHTSRIFAQAAAYSAALIQAKIQGFFRATKIA